jgi:hypothetical protein
VTYGLRNRQSGSRGSLKGAIPSGNARRATLSEPERGQSEPSAATETQQWPAAANAARKARLRTALLLAAVRVGVAA